jgi:hypothetical protein
MTTQKTVLFVLLTVVVLAFDLAVALGMVAQSRGVESVVVPPASLIETIAADADYSRAYRIPVSSQAFPSVASLRRPRFARRMQISGSGPSEIVYRGRLPALQYHVAYSLAEVGGQQYLTISTAIHYRHWLALLYGGGVRFVQWGLVPMAASRLVERSSGP